jgi:hypothetical protein
MAATINGTRVFEGASPIAAEQTKVTDATQIARYCMLEELPGLIFGVLTVGYIVMSLTRLAN